MFVAMNSDSCGYGMLGCGLADSARLSSAVGSGRPCDLPRNLLRNWQPGGFDLARRSCDQWLCTGKPWTIRNSIGTQ